MQASAGMQVDLRINNGLPYEKYLILKIWPGQLYGSALTYSRSAAVVGTITILKIEKSQHKCMLEVDR